MHVRHEEYGVFAAVADASLTGQPTVVCGTAGPGVTHLINGLIDARKEGAPVIAIAGDVESSLIDSEALLRNSIRTSSSPRPRCTPAAWSNPHQLRTVAGTAITTAVAQRGPTVISLPGDVAAVAAPKGPLGVALPATSPSAMPCPSDLDAMATMINEAATVLDLRRRRLPRRPGLRYASWPPSSRPRSATRSRASSGSSTTTRTRSA